MPGPTHSPQTVIATSGKVSRKCCSCVDAQAQKPWLSLTRSFGPIRQLREQTSNTPESLIPKLEKQPSHFSVAEITVKSGSHFIPSRMLQILPNSTIVVLLRVVDHLNVLGP